MGNSLVEELCHPGFALDAEGYISVPSAPGLGIEIDRDRLRAFEANAYVSETWTWDVDRLYEAAIRHEDDGRRDGQ